MAEIQVPGHEILEVISDGAMGVVYKARQLSLNRTVAVKVIHRHLMSDPTAVAQFRLEANSVANLKHPNILQIHEAGETDGLLYFVMEYVAAYSVASWLTRKGVLAEKDALTIADAVARALQYAWEKAGLIHCDLKPGNILVDEDGSVKIADFSGISRSNLSREAELLREVTIGTPNYMAPEQVRGLADIDCRVDIYALGAVLYHLVTGVLPFEHCSDGEAMRQHVEGTLTDPAELNPAVSAHFSMMIEKLMVKDRDQRPATWEMVLADIERVRAGLPPLPPLAYPGSSTVKRTVQPPAAAPIVRPKSPPVFAPPSPAPAPLPSTMPRPRRRLLWTLGATALALLVLDVALIAFWPRSPLKRRRSPPTEPVEPLPPPPPPPTAAPPTVVAATTAPPPTVVSPPRPPRPAETSNVVDTTPAPTTQTVAAAPPQPPPSPPTPAVEAAPQRPSWPEYRDYLKLMQEAMSECARRNYAGAQAILQTWLRANPSHPMRDQVAVELERFRSLPKLLAILEENTRALWGRSIQYTPGVIGNVLAVRGLRITLARRLGEGTAEADYDLLRLSAQDLVDLLRAADETHFPLNAARFLLGEMQFAAVDAHLANAQRIGLPADELTAWLKDWRSIALNVRADRAIDEIGARVEAGDLTGAASSLEAAVPAYAQTDVFQWGRAAEIEALRARIQNRQPPLPADPAVAKPGPGPAARPASSDDVDAADVEQVNAGELAARMRELDGRIIRLRFRYRTTISETGPGMYGTDVGVDSATVRVEFSQEGYRWFRNSVNAGYVLDQPVRVAYGVVDARRQVVRLLGRTMKRRLGGPDEFAW